MTLMENELRSRQPEFSRVFQQAGNWKAICKIQIYCRHLYRKRPTSRSCSTVTHLEMSGSRVDCYARPPLRKDVFRFDPQLQIESQSERTRMIAVW